MRPPLRARMRSQRRSSAARYRDALALPAGEGGAVLAAKGQHAALRNERREAGELYGPGDLLLREGAEHG